VTIAEPEIGAFVAVFMRATALVMSSPVTGDAGVPARAKLVFITAISIALSANRPGVMYAQLPLTCFLEIDCGVITGLTARFVLARIAVAGQLMGLALGLGFAAEFDPHAGESAGILRTLATTLAGLAFLSTGGLSAIVQSCATPVNPWLLTGDGTQLLVEGANAFGHGLAIAAPIMLAALVGNLGVAVLNRAAPGVNVFSVALGAVLCLGCIMALATAGNFIGSVTAAAEEATKILAP
jgi:flagellar biosynthetic protein FliR